MRKLVWHGGNRLQLENSQDGARSPRAEEVLLKVKAVGICGTDIHIMNGTVLAPPPPFVLGHEISGEVAEVGEEVRRVRPGDRVTVDSVVGCGHCNHCLRGSLQFCQNGFEFGISRDGGCQEYLLLPERNVYPVPATISFEEAAILDVEVWNAVRKCGILPCDSVLILGAGPIGLIACQVVRQMGARHVALGDVLENRLKTAKPLNFANEYIWIQDQQAEPDRSMVCSMDVVIDCAGTAPSTEYALSAVKPGGRVLLYGVYETPIEKFDLNQIVLKDLVLFGALCDRTGWEEVIALVTTGGLDLKSFITHRVPLEQGAQAYKMVQNRENGVIKAVLMI